MMARQSGPLFIEGTLDDLTFYKMQGEYFVRMKSRLTRKKVLNSPRFVLTRMHANQLAEASRIASIIYKQIPKDEKNIRLFRSIVGKAKLLLFDGKEKEEIIDLLMKEALEYRTRNKEQMNDEVISERSKVKNEKCKVKNVKRIDFKQKGKMCKERKVTKKKEHSSSLLINEVGRLIDETCKSTPVLNYIVLDPSASLSRGSG